MYRSLESAATNLKRDFKADESESLSLKSMYNVFMNEDALKKYEDEFAQLKNVNKNAQKLRGHMYFLNGELVAFVSVDLRGDKTWIDTLEVVKKFRGNHLSFQLLDVAVKKFHATDLRVHKENEKAIAIFKTYGFKVYDKKNQYLYMSIKADTKEIEPDEADVEPIVNKLSTEKIENKKKQIASESVGGTAMDSMDIFLVAATEAAFGKKGTDELLVTAKRNLSKKLKTVEDCDAYLDTLKTESTKFNEATNTLISAKAKYEAGKMSKAELRKTTRAATILLTQNCKKLQVSLGQIIDDTKAITRQDIKNFAEYVAGLKKVTNEIKAARKKGVAVECAAEEEFDPDDFACESVTRVMVNPIGAGAVAGGFTAGASLGTHIGNGIASHINAGDSKGEGYAAAKSLVKQIKKQQEKLMDSPTPERKSKIKELKARLDVINARRKKAGYFEIAIESATADDFGIDSLFSTGNMTMVHEAALSTEELLLNLPIGDLMALEAADLPDDEDGKEVKEEIDAECEDDDCEDKDDDKKKKDKKKKSKSKSKDEDDDDDNDDEDDDSDESDEDDNDDADDDDEDEKKDIKKKKSDKKKKTDDDESDEEDDDKDSDKDDKPAAESFGLFGSFFD